MPVSLEHPLLTADDVAGLFGGDISAKTVLLYAREGRIRCLRIGRHVRFMRGWLEEDLERLI